MHTVAEVLHDFSPDVEISKNKSGVFWLHASGLGTLYPSIGAWCRAIRTRLKKGRFESTIVVGFSKFGTYAALCAKIRKVTVFRDHKAEREAVGHVLLERLELDRRLLATLHQLNVYTSWRYGATHRYIA